MDATEEAITYEHPIIVESDGEPPSEEEEEDKYSHEVGSRSHDFERHGLAHDCPRCIRMRRGAKPPYRHNQPCRNILEKNIKEDDRQRWERYELRKPSDADTKDDSSTDEDAEVQPDPWWFVHALHPGEKVAPSRPPTAKLQPMSTGIP